MKHVGWNCTLAKIQHVSHVTMPMAEYTNLSNLSRSHPQLNNSRWCGTINWHSKSQLVLCRPGLKAASWPEQAAASPAISKPQLWLGQAYGSGFTFGRLSAWAQAPALGGWIISIICLVATVQFRFTVCYLKSTFFFIDVMNNLFITITDKNGLHCQWGWDSWPRPRRKPKPSPSQPQAMLTAQASVLRSLSCWKPSQSQGLQAEPGLHNTNLNTCEIEILIITKVLQVWHIQGLCQPYNSEKYKHFTGSFRSEGILTWILA